MKDLISALASILYLYNLIYAFIYWGVGHGLLNLLIPYAVIADIVKSVGQLNHTPLL